ncbi:unnamed protein product [Amaranthus hypochondriacus]
MARDQGRPRKQVVQQRKSSSSSSKGSVSGGSYSTPAVFHPQTDPTILEHEILSPRSSLAQLQSHSLYSNWAPVVNGGASSSNSSDPVMHMSTTTNIRVSPTQHGTKYARAGGNNGLNVSNCMKAAIDASHSGLKEAARLNGVAHTSSKEAARVNGSRVGLTQKWVPKPTLVAPTSASIVDEEGCQLVTSRRVPAATIPDPPSSTVLLNTSNGFKVLATWELYPIRPMRNILWWNVRGLNVTRKQFKLARFISQHHISLFGLLETKVKRSRLGHLYHNLCPYWCLTNNLAHHKGGRIIVGWDPVVLQERMHRDPHNSESLEMEVKCAQALKQVKKEYGSLM